MNLLSIIFYSEKKNSLLQAFKYTTLLFWEAHVSSFT